MVKLLDHVAELAHDLSDLARLLDAGLSENVLVVGGNSVLRELEDCPIGGGVPLENDANHKLHGEPDKRFVLCSLNVYGSRQLDYLLQQSRLYQAIQNVPVRDLVQLDDARLLAVVACISCLVREWHLDNEIEKSKESKVRRLLRNDSVLLVLDLQLLGQRWVAKRRDLGLRWHCSVTVFDDLQKCCEVPGDREELGVFELCVDHEDGVLLLEDLEGH